MAAREVVLTSIEYTAFAMTEMFFFIDLKLIHFNFDKNVQELF